MAESDLQFALPDAAATDVLGAALGSALPGRPSALRTAATLVLYLHGELGAGKTTCVRSLLRACGVTGLIRSPTFTLVEAYRTRAPHLRARRSVPVARAAGGGRARSAGLPESRDAS